MDNEINKAVQAKIDNISSLEVEEEVASLLNSQKGQKTTIIHFDSDKPANDSTGLPPVKTIITQETKHEEQRQKNRQSQLQSEAEHRQATIYKRCEAHAQYVEVEEPTLWERLKQGIANIALIPALIFALWAIYKHLIKR